MCEFYLRKACARSALCPFRHRSGDKSVVCKHWLRGLCKKGDLCEFLHEYDMTKMPECYFFSKYGRSRTSNGNTIIISTNTISFFVLTKLFGHVGVCNNKDCPYQHIDPKSKIKDCPWYDRGFCKHGMLSFARMRLLSFLMRTCFLLSVFRSCGFPSSSLRSIVSKSARSTRTLRQLFVWVLQGRRQLQVQAVSWHEIASLCIWTTLFLFLQVLNSSCLLILD